MLTRSNAFSVSPDEIAFDPSEQGEQPRLAAGARRPRSAEGILESLPPLASLPGRRIRWPRYRSRVLAGAPLRV